MKYLLICLILAVSSICVYSAEEIDSVFVYDTFTVTDSLVHEESRTVIEPVQTEHLSLGQAIQLHLNSDYKFNANQLIVPGALLVVGITGVYAFPGVRHEFRNSFKGSKAFVADDYLQFLTAAAYLGIGFIPKMPQRGDFRDKLMAGITAYAVMGVVSNVMKYSFKAQRPGNNKRKTSFPSGHSAMAFTGAELMRIEYGNLAGLAGYAVACTVGMLRVYNDWHWINDILGGAAVGILSARIGYWLLPWERKLFGLDKKSSKFKGDVSIMPMVGESNGLACSLVF